MFSKLLKATTVALAASIASAQTFTECDPTKRSKSSSGYLCFSDLEN